MSYKIVPLPIAPLLERAIPYIPNEIVRPLLLKKVCSFLSGILCNLSIDRLCIEHPMTYDQADPDIIIQLSDDVFSSEMNFASLESLNSNQIENSYWDEFAQFQRKYRTNRLIEKNSIPFWWLEFDLGSAPAWPPPPNMAFQINKLKNISESIKNLAYLLRGQKVKKETLDQLATYPNFQLSPTHAGFMIGRDAQSIRLFLQTPTVEDLFDKFSYIFGASEEKDRIAYLFKRIYPYLCQQKINIQIDLESPRMPPLIAIECSPKGNSLYDLRVTWLKIFDLLRAENFITERNYRLAINWTSAFREDESIFVRKVNHIKFVYEPGGRMYAKAYFTIAHGALKILK